MLLSFQYRHQHIFFCLGLPSLPLFPFLLSCPVQFSGHCGAVAISLCVHSADSTAGLLWAFPNHHSQLMIMCMRGVPLPYFCLNVKIYSAPCLKPGPVFITSIKNSVHPNLALIFWQKIYSSKIGATYFYWHSSCSTQLCPLLCLLQLSVCPFSYLQALHMLNSVHFGFGG